MKLYLVQEKLPDGEMFAKMKPATEIINDFGFRDCTDAEYEVYDVSEFGKIVKLEHWPAISAPFNNWGNEPEPDSADGCVNYVDRKVIEGLLQPKPFKNVRPEQVKHLIVKTIEEFREDVRSAVHKSAYPFVSCGKVEFFDDIGYRSKYETMSRLSEYYGVEVVAVEPEDEVEAKRVLIEFTEKEKVVIRKIGGNRNER